MKKVLLFCMAAVAVVGYANVASAQTAESITVKMDILDPKNGNKAAGDIVITETEYGLVFTPALTGLTPGLHGFHIHTNADCGANKEGVAGMAAGGHWDPANVKSHSFPWDDKGHKGDLPALFVDDKGGSINPVLAPKLKKLSDVKGHSVMVHMGGDNHNDKPTALGGGGARMACGVIK